MVWPRPKPRLAGEALDDPVPLVLVIGKDLLGIAGLFVMHHEQRLRGLLRRPLDIGALAVALFGLRLHPGIGAIGDDQGDRFVEMERDPFELGPAPFALSRVSPSQGSIS